MLAWLVACAFLFVWPDEDDPQRADAVVVLAGGRKDRLARGLELMRRDVADTLVISDGEAAGWVDANALCDRGRGDGFRVVCFHPDPYSTQGEARGVARLARESRWRRVALVTSTSHVHRARLLFERCLAGDVEAVGTGHKLRYLLSSLVWESAKLTYALTAERSC